MPVMVPEHLLQIYFVALTSLDTLFINDLESLLNIMTIESLIYEHEQAFPFQIPSKIPAIGLQQLKQPFNRHKSNTRNG